ncbi:MAG: right-handed parallel beta-helix repeat-containing protein [Acutalibacteraceae bacterium]
MKKTASVLLCIAMILTFVPLTSFAVSGNTYYIDSVSGDDLSLGTSEAQAWKTTANIASLKLQAGDKILFKRDGIYDCTLSLTCSGTAENPIVISAYGEGERPLLTTGERNAVLKLFDCDYVSVSDVEITAHNGGGIWVDALSKNSCGITLDNIVFHDMQNYKVKTRDNFAEGPISGRAAVVVRRYGNRLYSVDDFTAINCEIYDCGNGIFFTGDSAYPNKNALVKNVYLHDLDGEAIVLESCDGARITDCRAINCCLGEGIDENGNKLYYIAAVWTHYSSNCTIQNCEIAGQKCVTDGMTVDFDHWSFNCTYEYIYSHDNTSFMVNNSKEDNPNRGNTVRYCLSVNDGGRSRLSTSAGEYDFRFYNNTIVGCGDFDFDDTFDGIVANNIIDPAKESRLSYDRSEIKASGTIFTHNCYYNTMTPLFEPGAYNVLPGFSGEDLSDPGSFTLSADSPLIGAGYSVQDDCTTDFFGNTITSQNIGCYGGNGTDAKYPKESVIQKAFRTIRYVLETIVKEIRYNADRLIKKAKKYLDEKF